MVAPPVGIGRDTKARAAARETLARVIWSEDGSRRLPKRRELVAAIAACCAQDSRDVWWVCEAARCGPVYLLPTREWMRALAAQLDAWQARTVVEVAAGDGFLSRCLRAERPALRVVATDNHAWKRASARQSRADRRDCRGVRFAGIAMPDDVERLSATRAVAKYKPDVVLVSWAPPGLLVERCIRGPCRRVLEISVDGDVCGNGMRTWRFHKQFLDGPIVDEALCRLDVEPAARGERATRITAYYGARHRDFGVDDVRYG